MAGSSTDPLADVDQARSREYLLLSRLLLKSPDVELMARLAELPGDASPLGQAHRALADAAARVDAERAAREYFDLFIGVGRGELVPYASHYLTGSLHGRPLAWLRATLRRIGIEPVEGLVEPEDHAAVLLEVMGALAGGVIPTTPGAALEIFNDHLVPLIGRFFSDLEQAKSADFYAAVGALGRTFIGIEIGAFAMPR
jgi:TorA maturation chaperone TorD